MYSALLRGFLQSKLESKSDQNAALLNKRRHKSVLIDNVNLVRKYKT